MSGHSRPAFSRMAIKRAVQPAETAAAALFLAEREDAMITCHALNVAGGFNVTGILYDQ